MEILGCPEVHFPGCKHGALVMNPRDEERTFDISTRPLEIAYVLFMDIVAYSLLPIDHQSEAIQKLQRIVRQREEFEKAQAANQVIYLPTGDGMALAFFNDPCAPVRCARGISLVAKQRATFQLRMGIHFGPIYRHDDINSSANVAGGGINIAQRIMDCGDGGHVLVSKAVADVLLQLSEWKSMVHHLGEHEVKHGLRIEVFNIFSEDFGNQETPSKLKVSSAKPVKERALDVALGKEIPVFVPTELVALIRLTQSEGLKGVLESDPDYSVTPSDVRSKPLVLEFPVDSKGHPAPLDVTLRVASPDFDPKSQSKIIRVPPSADSETCIFLLTPTQLGELRVNVELYSGDVTLLSRVLKTRSNTSDRLPTEVNRVIVTIPLTVLVRPSELGLKGADFLEFRTIMDSDGRDKHVEDSSFHALIDEILGTGGFSKPPVETQPQPETAIGGSNEVITGEISTDLVREARALGTGDLKAAGQPQHSDLQVEPPHPQAGQTRSWRNLIMIALVVVGAAIVIRLSFLTQHEKIHRGAAPYWDSRDSRVIQGIFERPDQIVAAELTGSKSSSRGSWVRAKTLGEYVFLKPGILRFNLLFRGPLGNPSGRPMDMRWVVGYLSPQEEIVYQFDGTNVKREAFSTDGSASTTVPCSPTARIFEFSISIEAKRVVVASPSCDHADSYDSTRDLTVGKVGIKSNADFLIRLLSDTR